MIYPHTGFFIVDGQAVQPSATPAWPWTGRSGC